MRTAIKKIFIVIPMLVASVARAQTAAEWFSQKSTQKKYLLQQIAALQVYSKYLRTGYGIAKGGLGSITSSLRSENALHTAYYSRLKTAAPPVKGSAMIKEILNWQRDILTRVQELNKESGGDPDEQKYLSSVASAVMADCDLQLQTLASITQDGKLEMSDADRLGLLDKVHSSMIDNYRFITAFTIQVKVYVTRKRFEQNQVKITKRLNGIY